tara:strand:+ start:5524 stop:7416 length:1893 start_codon:yes stop_codon:yes gene_type:complete
MVKIIKILLFFSLSLFAKESFIDVITTNDLHGFLGEQDAYFMNPNFPPKIVGASALYKYIKDVEKKLPNKSDDILIFDGGNFFQGHPTGIIDSGKTVIEWMNKVGYDAIVPGSNDFLFGHENLLELASIANFPFLSCNIRYEETNELLFKPYEIINIKGLKVGVLGLSNSNIKETVLEKNIEGIKIEPSIESMNFWISKLVDNVDIIVLLTSSGVPWDREDVYKDFIDSIKNENLIDKHLNAIELGYYADNVDIIISGGISKGYRTPWYDKNSHTYTFQNYGNGTSFGHFFMKYDFESKLFTGYKSAVTNSISQTLFIDDFTYDLDMHNWLKEKNDLSISDVYKDIDWSSRIDSDDQDITINQTSNQWDFPNINNVNGLDIITWNCEFFPANGDLTIDALSEAIIEMNPDIVAFQEIKKRGWFSKLMLYLPEYDYIISQQSSFMDQAIIYKKNLFDLVSRKELFAENDYFFAGRPPLQCDLLFKDNNQELSIINLHMKCCDSGLKRRKLAAKQLYDYVKNNLNESLSNQYIILGDWNDDLKDDTGEHCFDSFLNDSTMFFPTLDITYDLRQASYPKEPYVSFLDHILVSNSLVNGKSYTVKTLPIDDYMGSYAIYEEYISDHMPVLLSIY